MTITIIGSQSGDKGRGALVDLWGGDADIVVRYQDGDSVGHTVVEDGGEYRLLLVPSGAVRDKIGVPGNGCVINPRTLFSEIDDPHERGFDLDVHLVKHAYVIIPHHRHLDNIEEEAKADSDLTVDMTGRDIGPTHEDRASHRGIHVGDLFNPDVLRQRLEYIVPQKKAFIKDVYGLEAGEKCGIEALVEKYTEIGRRFREDDAAVDCGGFLTERRKAGGNMMFEGMQDTLIDIDHGSYPYVTSSSPTVGGATTDTGVGPTVVGQGEVVGIIKSYPSRVGEGPMPIKLKGGNRDEEFAEFIHGKGSRSGTITGRPRHIGWLDMSILHHVACVSGFAGIAVDHLDVLIGLNGVRVGHAYELEGEEHLAMPATTERWGGCELVLKEFDTWPEVGWVAVAEENYDAISDAAQDCLEYLSGELDVPIYTADVGPGHEQAIHIENPFDD